MRILIDTVAGQGAVVDPSDDQLRAAYAIPWDPWLRVNFVETVDGAATGESGKSGSINNAADKRIFDQLRAQADVIIIGAGTARIEGYRPAEKPILLVTSSGRIPESLAKAPRGKLLIATHASSPRLAQLRVELGEECVLVLGESTVDLVALKSALAERGFAHLLSEGGPSLFTDMLAAGVVDEVCTTTVPRLVGGPHVRISQGQELDAELSLATLLEEDGTLIARWFVSS